MLACFFIAFYMFASRRNAAHYRSDDAGACCFFFAYFLLLPKQKRELRSFLLCLIPLFATTKWSVWRTCDKAGTHKISSTT